MDPVPVPTHLHITHKDAQNTSRAPALHDHRELFSLSLYILHGPQYAYCGNLPHGAGFVFSRKLHVFTLTT